MFRSLVTLILSLGFILSSVALGDAKIDPSLAPFARGEGTHPVVRVVALLKSPMQFTRFDQSYRYNAAQVQKFLMARSKAALAPVWAAIEASTEARNNIQFGKIHAINNSFSADVTRDGLKFLAFNENITKIYLNGHITYEKARKVQPGRGFSEAQEMPYDFKEIGLDKVISEMPKATGVGAIVGHVDTGVDGSHPALQGKILAFFNGKTRKPGEPVDFDQHGTHTAGTVLGGDRSSLLIGMAPGAKLVSAGALLDYDTMLEGMKWMMDPDGNPQTKDFPKLVTNSWNCEGAPDVELFYNAISAWEAAGILPVFSAGNAGPRPGTITKPHEHPMTFAVAATGPDGKVADFSSRGPGMFHGKATQKPEISAPGVNINSSVPGGRYAKMDGTSMATPHVAGALALFLQLKPDLTPMQMREMLIKSATPTAQTGSEWNAEYGFGKLDIYKALKSLVNFNRQMLNLGNGTPFSFSSLLTSPADEDMQTFVDSSGYQAFSPFPTDMEGSTWLTASEVFQ